MHVDRSRYRHGSEPAGRPTVKVCAEGGHESRQPRCHVGGRCLPAARQPGFPGAALRCTLRPATTYCVFTV